jgi:hypothetical protein
LADNLEQGRSVFLKIIILDRVRIWDPQLRLLAQTWVKYHEETLGILSNIF